jgi:predicted nucleic acid-binding protein
MPPSKRKRGANSTTTLDTSVLLAGLIDFGDSSMAPIALLDRLAAGGITRPTTAWHCCLELFSVATRLPEEYRLTPADARRLLAEEILERFEVRDLPAERRAPLFAEAESDSLVGGRIYDAEVGAVALAAGATVLVTGNRRHFAPLLRHGLRVLSASELLDDLPASQG